MQTTHTTTESTPTHSVRPPLMLCYVLCCVVVFVVLTCHAWFDICACSMWNDGIIQSQADDADPSCRDQGHYLHFYLHVVMS